MTTSPRNITDSFSTFEDLWSPHTLATINDTEVRLTKVAGEYVWHRHTNSDEMFIVIDGHLSIDVRDVDDNHERRVELAPHDTFVVARGVEHRPSSVGGVALPVIVEVINVSAPA